MVYLLRTSPCSSSPGVAQLDEVIKGALTTLCNLKLDAGSWAQASLPVRWGGVGVRRLWWSSRPRLSSPPCTRQAPQCRPFSRPGPSKRRIQPLMRHSPSGRHWGVRTLLQARTVVSRGHGTMECAPRGLLDCCSAPTSLIALACSHRLLLAQRASLHEPRPTPRQRGIAHSAWAALGCASRARASLYLRGRGGV